jgi:hypothetical protein
MRALWVAPFISADESLVRCRQGADEMKALIRDNDALKRENADLRERLDGPWSADIRGAPVRFQESFLDDIRARVAVSDVVRPHVKLTKARPRMARVVAVPSGTNAIVLRQ